MFTIPRVNVVESDAGFSVEVLGRTGLRYVEGSKTMFINSEVLMGPVAMMVDATSIKSWDSPNERVAIDDVARKHIIENVRAAFRFRGVEIQVFGEPGA
jgi:hypothetical protein